MRGKRSKQYRKLMEQYGLTYGFREAYQVLVDADIIKDADKFKMDLQGGLERTLHGQTKLMITQCSMRHLYAAASEPGVSYLIDKAKTYERRRCGHRPEDFPEPLSTKECISSVVDPKGSGTNKHRYVVASQDLEVRKAMRNILGVPLVYINRSVMIMEPMADASSKNREKEEKIKFRDGLRGSGSLKRKRDEDAEEDGAPVTIAENGEKKKAKKKWGVKEPNPLSVKKPKKKKEDGVPSTKKIPEITGQPEVTEPVVKKKRKRTHSKKNKEGTENADAGGNSVSEVAESASAVANTS